jgi:hypothetical protein
VLYNSNLSIETYLSSTILFSVLAISTIIFFCKAKYDGLSFQLGILFAVLFFLAPPSLFLIFSGTVEVDRFGFGGTDFKDIHLNESAIPMLILSIYMLLISFWTLFTQNSSTEVNNSTYQKSKTYLLNVIYLTLIYSLFFSVIIFIFSGLSSGGGNWYESSAKFWEQFGFIGVILNFSHFATRLIFVTTFFFYFKTFFNSRSLGILLLLLFGLFDSYITGNRIFLFVSLALLGCDYLKDFGKREAYQVIIITPLVLIMGLASSAYGLLRHYISAFGIPSFEELSLIFENFEFDEWGFKSAILGMFESINFNVVMSIFNETTINNIFYGESYLKVFFTFIPRSIWPNKPESIALEATKILSPSEDHLSLALTMIGEMHFNFLYFGILLIIPFLIFLNKICNSCLALIPELRNYFLFGLGVLMFRMSFSDTFMVFIISFLIMSLLKIKIEIKQN